MSHNQLGHSTVHTVSHKLPELCKGLPPLSEDKNPVTAAILGLLFGPFGIGIYFKSGVDFAICFGILILLSLTGVLAPVGWVMAAAYGAHRAKESNKKRQELRNVPPIITVEAAAIPQPPIITAAFTPQPPALPPSFPPLPPEPLVYLSIRGQSCGPFSDTQVQQKLASHEISNATLFWMDGMPSWKPIGMKA
jgi:hypothetical protein